MRVLPSSGNTRTELISFNGGLDTVTPPLKLPPGFCRRAQNFEQDINGGYRRCMGYERFDGQASPSDAIYAYLPASIAVALSVGETVTGATSAATGVVVAYGDGYMVLAEATGTFVSETVDGSVTGAGAATVVGPAVANGASTTLLHAQWTNLAADHQRSQIAAVPGSGSVLGVWVYDDVTYAFRNNAGATAVDMYKATAAGWVQVTFTEEVGFTNANTNVQEGDTLTQGGVTSVIRRIALYSGTLASGTNTGRFIISGRAGGNYAAGAATTTGAGAVTLSGAQTAITIPNTGGRFEFANARFADVGNELRMYGVDGANRAFEFDGTYFCPITSAFDTDRPQHLFVHKDTLWLSHEGTVIFGNAGNPFGFDSYTGFAGALALGDTVTGMVSQPGGQAEAALAIFARNEIGIVYGSDSTDFNLIPYKQEAGAIAHTLQQLGQTMMFDDRGITTLSASQQYGNFADSTISQQVQSWLTTRRSQVTASCIARDKNQYRLFFSDGSALYVTMRNKKLVGMMPQYFAHEVRCICSVEASDGSELMFFGSDDGFVYQMERGTSFDGEAIEYYLHLAFANFGGPRQKKRFRECMFELEAEGYVDFFFSYELGYNSTAIAQPSGATITPGLSALAFWDSFTWDAFTWDGRTLLPASADMVGSAENVSLVILGNSDYHVPIRFSGAIVHFDPRRQLRN